MVLGYGVDLAIHETASRLVARGHQAEVWTPTQDGSYAGAPYRLREFIVYGNAHNRALPVFEYNAFKALKALAAQLKGAGEGYDIVVPCTHPYYGAGRAFGLPQAFWNFGNVPHLGFSFKQSLNYGWLDYSENLFHKPQSAAVVSISRFLHEQQALEVQQHGCVVPLGGDHYLSPGLRTAEGRQARRAQARARWGIPPEAVLLGYCSRLHRQHALYKGMQEALALGRRLQEQVPRVRLAVCGSGSPEDEEWVRGAGALPLANLPASEMADFFCALDIYVCPSKWEGFNLPLLEAAWLGVPGVAYAVGAHGEHAAALLVDELSYDELCRATLTLVRDQDLRSHFAQQALASAQRFSWEASARQFEAALEAVLPDA